MYTILDGKATSAKIKQEVAQMVADYKSRGLRVPHLTAILVGHDGGSETYVANKAKTCHEVGFTSEVVRFEDDVTEETLLAKIAEINADPSVDGLIVQLPLPKHIKEIKVIEAIDSKKDVDGFHPKNMGRMLSGLRCFLPATPYGICRLLAEYKIDTAGKNCVIVGRSNIVGKPLANLLMRRADNWVDEKDMPSDCTVTICNSKTKDIAYYTRNADILVAALGHPGFIKADMVKEGAIVVDVGTTRVPDSSRPRGYRLCGDVDFENVAPKCSYISPVPGGCGPMTIISLVWNTLLAYQNKLKKGRI